MTAAEAPREIATGVGEYAASTTAPPEHAAKASQMIARMEASADLVQRRLREARAHRDIVKSLCLSDKLTQLHVTARAGHERRQDLTTAIDRGDLERAAHTLTLLGVLEQRADRLNVEANQCLGVGDVPLSRSGQMTTTAVDPGMPPTDDVTRYPNDVIILSVPSCSSCVR